MIKKKIQDALNKQINAEIYSAYLYLSMNAHSHSIELTGFANWLFCQYQEEMMHAMKMYDYVNERGGRIILDKIEKPKTEWKSPTKMFEHVYNHEKKVTGLINGLVDLSIKEKDHATTNFLQWFVAEQVEEEASASSVLQKLKLVGNEGNGLFMLDKELSTRVFTPPPKKGE